MIRESYLALVKILIEEDYAFVSYFRLAYFTDDGLDYIKGFVEWSGMQIGLQIFIFGWACSEKLAVGSFKFDYITESNDISLICKKLGVFIEQCGAYFFLKIYIAIIMFYLSVSIIWEKNH